MIVFQVPLLSFGIAGGWLIASRLRRLPWDHSTRVRAVVAFGAGAAAWIGFALIALSGPVAWTFIGTVLALYLPSLIAIVASGGGAVEPVKTPNLRLCSLSSGGRFWLSESAITDHRVGDDQQLPGGRHQTTFDGLPLTDCRYWPIRCGRRLRRRQPGPLPRTRLARPRLLGGGPGGGAGSRIGRGAMWLDRVCTRDAG